VDLPVRVAARDQRTLQGDSIMRSRNALRWRSASLFVPGTAMAADATPTLNAGDTAWMLTATALVLFS
jgi:hypothetical protein